MAGGLRVAAGAAQSGLARGREASLEPVPTSDQDRRANHRHHHAAEATRVGDHPYQRMAQARAGVLSGPRSATKAQIRRGFNNVDRVANHHSPESSRPPIAGDDVRVGNVDGRRGRTSGGTEKLLPCPAPSRAESRASSAKTIESFLPDLIRWTTLDAAWRSRCGDQQLRARTGR